MRRSVFIKVYSMLSVQCFTLESRIMVIGTIAQVPNTRKFPPISTDLYLDKAHSTAYRKRLHVPYVCCTFISRFGSVLITFPHPSFLGKGYH